MESGGVPARRSAPASRGLQARPEARPKSRLAPLTSRSPTPPSRARRVERVRVFVALDIPAEVRAAAAALVVKLRPACRNARWVRTEGAHITLKFIGEVPSEKTKAIEAALAPIQTPAPIEMNFRGVGFFPNDSHLRV